MLLSAHVQNFLGSDYLRIQGTADSREVQNILTEIVEAVKRNSMKNQKIFRNAIQIRHFLDVESILMWTSKEHRWPLPK